MNKVYMLTLTFLAFGCQISTDKEGGSDKEALHSKTMKHQILQNLSAFRAKDKFSEAAWNDRGLIPSDSNKSSTMDLHLNACTEDLINQIQNGAANSQIKKTLKSGLSSFNKGDYDTEEKEFICDYFFELAQIVEVDFKDDLNSWLYGSTFNAFMKVVNAFKKPEQIQETLSQDCTKCESKLETFIMKKEAGIPDYAYQVVKCKECGEFNMIEVGNGVKELRFGNYEPVEQLRKDEYTEEQAKIRLEQIKYFKNK